MRKTKRREFLKLSVGAGLALGTPLVLESCWEHPIIEPQTTTKNKGFCYSWRQPIFYDKRCYWHALGGIETIVNKGETVFIKPNFVTFPWVERNNSFHVGECTKPEIILAVTEECLKAGAAEVIIGDGSQLPLFEWHNAITLDGTTNLVTESER